VARMWCCICMHQTVQHKAFEGSKCMPVYVLLLAVLQGSQVVGPGGLDPQGGRLRQSLVPERIMHQTDYCYALAVYLCMCCRARQWLAQLAWTQHGPGCTIPCAYP
jgi:hypothetical protein